MAFRSKLRIKKSLARLAFDTGGNALAMMGMAIFPLVGIVGGGVDMSRLYLAKTRLQQACDAGALAGRKVMGAGDWNYDNYAARDAAEEFFAGNFQTGAYGSGTLTRNFTEDSGKVEGTASVVMPMTLMKIFGSATKTLNVTCDAEMRLPNTDIMFVLDNTGSMAAKASATDTDTKIVALKKAVKCFYETVAKTDTNADCGSTPSGGVSDETQVRFGFVPYSTNVNVGKLLPTDYFANSWTYQSRQQLTTTETYYTFETPGTATTSSTGTSDIVNGAWSIYSTTTLGSSAACNASKPAETDVSSGTEGAPYDQVTTGSGSTQTVTWKTKEPYTKQQYQASFDGKKNKNGTCTIEKRTVNYNLVRNYSRTDAGTANTRQVFNQWRYGQVTHDISGLKNGTSWNDNLILPIGTSGADKIIGWDGCIEERATIRKSSYSSLTSTETTDAKDLNIDLVPTQGDAGSLWKPALPDVIYTRQKTSGGGSYNTGQIDTATEYTNNSSYYCPAEARKLQTWATASEFEDYVDGLAPTGNTYHDIGMLWGARFISPTGIFSSENQFTAQGGEIQRHIVFMTDGETCTGQLNYTAYGIPWYDRRQTDVGTGPTAGCSNSSTTGGTLTEQVDARFPAICTAIKNKNVTVWVVYFGTTDATTTARMTNCATAPDNFKPAANATALYAAFAAIANQISQLRLTQ